MTLTTHQKERGLFALTAYSSSILILSFRNVFSSSISSTAYEQTKLRKVYQLRRYLDGDKTNSRHVKRGGQRERERKKNLWMITVDCLNISISSLSNWFSSSKSPTD